MIRCEAVFGGHTGTVGKVNQDQPKPCSRSVMSCRRILKTQNTINTSSMRSGISKLKVCAKKHTSTVRRSTNLLVSVFGRSRKVRLTIYMFFISVLASCRAAL